MVLLYLLLCPCCMTMRSSPKETKAFFASAKVRYKDSTIIIGEIPIHYIETGNPAAPTLFFVHGSPGSWNAYRNYLKDSLLLKKFRMVAIDRPGFGHSNFRQAENLAAQSFLIGELIGKIKNDGPVYLIGHSLGGPLIAQMAAERPNEYKALVILAGSLDPKAEKPEKWRYVFKSKPGRYLVPGALLPSNDELYWLKNDLIKLRPKLRKITSDVLIIHGTRDNLVPYSNVGFIKKEMTGARWVEVVSLKDADHFIPWDHYSEIRDRLLVLQ